MNHWRFSGKPENETWGYACVEKRSGGVFFSLDPLLGRFRIALKSDGLLRLSDRPLAHRKTGESREGGSGSSAVQASYRKVTSVRNAHIFDYVQCIYTTTKILITLLSIRYLMTRPIQSQKTDLRGPTRSMVAISQIF